MTRSSRRLTRLLATATAVSALAACGGNGGGSGGGGGGGENEASDIGITADSIKIGAHYPLTGVAAPGYSEIPTGVACYFEFVNDAGGVNGRTIDYVYRDDAYNPTNTSAVVNELVLQDEVFMTMGGLGTPTHSAVLDFLNGEGVPDLFVASGSLLWDNPEENPYTFGWQPDYEIEGKIVGQYIAENFPDAKVGLFLQDDDFGENGEAGVRQYIDDQIVAAERYVPGNVDVGPQIAALQAAGADFVVGFNVPSYTALSQLTALRLGYDPQWFYSNVGSDPALVGSLLSRFSEGKVSNASLLDGALTTEYLAGVDSADDPWVQLWQRVWDECDAADGELTNFRIYGMSQAYTAIQALQAAGQNPTRDGLVEAVEQAGGDFQGPAFAPFRYSADRHAGISGVQVARIAGAGAEELTPVLVTDNGDADIKESDAEPTTPPESGIPDVEPVVE
ncbi:MAG: ABC transporter substrate-binding protein [Actinomycetota bacterium]|nr:ABC transporter substrate-binding protein [Actinomycetota bacterium]